MAKDLTGGGSCFFSEAAFLRVMGPGPSLQERLASIASRPRTQKIVEKIKVNIDRSTFKSLPDDEDDDNMDQDVSVKKDESMSDIRGNDTVGKVLETDGRGITDSNSEAKTPEEKTDTHCDASNTETSDVLPSLSVDANEGQTMMDISPNENVSPKNSDSCDIDVNKSDKDACIRGGKPPDVTSNTNDSTDVSMATNSNEECGSKDVPDICNVVGESASVATEQDVSRVQEGVDDDDVCCLVMPNPSDEDSDGEDGKDGEEPFCLVMPSISSSDEQSSKEDFIEIYNKRKSLNLRPEASQLPVAISPTKRKAPEFKSPKTPVTPSTSSPSAKRPEQKQSDTLQKSSLQKDALHKEASQTVASPTTTTSDVPDDGSKRVEDLQPPMLAIGNDIECKTKYVMQDPAPSTIMQDPAPSTIGQFNGNVDKKPKETPKVFKNVRSKLSKKQHKRYVQLYKKYVCPMMKGNGKAVYSEAEMKDLVELEELQQHVTGEQIDYQEYLEAKAKRNSKSYNFLTPVAQVYSQERYRSYHRPRNYVRNYDPDCLFSIPLVLDDRAASCLMTFQKTLLKLGNSPRITIPDVKDGMNPVKIQAEQTSINDWFPSFNRNRGNAAKCMDHKMISEDSNAVKLAEEEEIDVVMSSSSFKCLLDNHASDVMRAWEIPVTVRHNPYGGPGSQTVYLDKPLYRDHVLMRDYNAIYHKYALRTFVSRPRDKGVTRIQANRSSSNNSIRNRSKVAAKRANRFTSEDLDIFSTGVVNDIDTFGSFTSNTSTRRSFNKTPNASVSSSLDNTTAESQTFVEKAPENQVKRFTRRSQTQNNPVNIPTTTATTAIIPNTSTESPRIESQINDTRNIRRSTRLSTSLESKVGKNQPTPQNQESETETPASKTDSAALKTTCAESSPDEPEKKRRRHKLDQSVDDLVESSSSKTESAVESSTSEVKMETDSPTSPVETESPASPPMETESPASPPMSEIQSIPLSLKVVSGSPTVVPLSPVREGSAPPVQDKAAPPSLLDSILGPSDKTPSTSDLPPNMADAPDVNDPEDFLPLTEKCNHVIYNQWKMGSLKVMVRCNYHGAIRDQGKLPRYVYVSPKMEYQADFGMEQVTLNEMTRSWASCFIRPGTSLVRARINAFTSELLMVEEKTIDGILNPALPFKPDHSFAVLRQIFEQLGKLPEGQYLLSHLIGDNACKVRKFNGKASLFPAPKKKRPGMAKHVPWIPIDPTILTPSHIHNSRIPATFMPSDWVLPVKNTDDDEDKNSQGASNMNPQDAGNRNFHRGGNSNRNFQRGANSNRNYQRGGNSNRNYQRGGNMNPQGACNRNYHGDSDSNPQSVGSGNSQDVSNRNYQRGGNSNRNYQRGGNSNRNYQRGGRGGNRNYQRGGNSNRNYQRGGRGGNRNYQRGGNNNRNFQGAENSQQNHD